jgi:hypothetical protein
MLVAVPIIWLTVAAAQPAIAQSTSPPRGGPGRGSRFGHLLVLAPGEATMKARVKTSGYTDVQDVKVGSEAMTAKAVKDDRSLNIIIDSFGKVIARPAE